MLRPSPNYGQLEVVANPEKMRSILQTELARVWETPVCIQRLDVPRVIPGDNGRLLIQYRFFNSEQAEGHSSGDGGVLFGHLLAPEEALPDPVDSQEVISLPEFRMQVPIFPFDAKLPALDRIFQQDTRSELLPSIFNEAGQKGASIIGTVQTLAYRPERRAVLRVQVANSIWTRSLVVKLAKPARAKSLFDRLQNLEQAGFHSSANHSIAVPHPIACSPQGLLWQEDVPDPSLHDLFGSDGFVSGCRAAAITLNKLHSTSIPELPIHRPAEEIRLLEKVSARLMVIYPEIGERVRNIWSRIGHDAPDGGDSQTVPVHRDYFDKQVLIGSDRTTLLDLDTLAQGDPAIDVGNFLAHLTLRGDQSPAETHRIVACRQTFIETYQISQTQFWNRVSWWEFATLLRLVCVYVLRPRWQEMALMKLRQIEESAAGRSGTDSGSNVP